MCYLITLSMAGDNFKKYICRSKNLTLCYKWQMQTCSLLKCWSNILASNTIQYNLYNQVQPNTTDSEHNLHYCLQVFSLLITKNKTAYINLETDLSQSGFVTNLFARQIWKKNYCFNLFWTLLNRFLIS